MLCKKNRHSCTECCNEKMSAIRIRLKHKKFLDMDRLFKLLVKILFPENNRMSFLILFCDLMLWEALRGA